MMESNEYSHYDDDAYNDSVADHHHRQGEDDGLLITQGLASSSRGALDDINFEDPKIANLPRILLMGPRRGGKTSIQVSCVQILDPICLVVPKSFGVGKVSNIHGCVNYLRCEILAFELWMVGT